MSCEEKLPVRNLARLLRLLIKNRIGSCWKFSGILLENHNGKFPPSFSFYLLCFTNIGIDPILDLCITSGVSFLGLGTVEVFKMRCSSVSYSGVRAKRILRVSTFLRGGGRHHQWLERSDRSENKT